MAEHGLDGAGAGARLGRHRARHATGPPGAASCSLVERGAVRAARDVPAAAARRRRPGDPRAVAHRARRARRRLRRRGAARRLPLFRAVDAGELEVVRRMLAGGVNAPPPTARARLRRGGRARARPAPSRFEGQVALALDAAGGRTRPARRPTRSTSTRSGPVERARPAPALARARRRRARGRRGRRDRRPASTPRWPRPAASWSRRAPAGGRLPVVLTGGCFQNARLAEGILGELCGRVRVYQHGQVPPGDGGIALGQAVVADAGRAADGGGDAMCLGVPGKVVAIDGLDATVDFFGVRKELRLDIVDEPVLGRRLRPEPRRVRHPAHPARGGRRRRSRSSTRSSTSPARRTTSWPPTCAARSPRRRTRRRTADAAARTSSRS